MRADGEGKGRVLPREGTEGIVLRQHKVTHGLAIANGGVRRPVDVRRGGLADLNIRLMLHVERGEIVVAQGFLKGREAQRDGERSDHVRAFVLDDGEGAEVVGGERKGRFVQPLVVDDRLCRSRPVLQRRDRLPVDLNRDVLPERDALIGVVGLINGIVAQGERMLACLGLCAALQPAEGAVAVRCRHDAVQRLAVGHCERFRPCERRCVGRGHADGNLIFHGNARIAVVVRVVGRVDDQSAAAAGFQQCIGIFPCERAVLIAVRKHGITQGLEITDGRGGRENGGVRLRRMDGESGLCLCGKAGEIVVVFNAPVGHEAHAKGRFARLRTVLRVGPDILAQRRVTAQPGFLQRLAVDQIRRGQRGERDDGLRRDMNGHVLHADVRGIGIILQGSGIGAESEQEFVIACIGQTGRGFGPEKLAEGIAADQLGFLQALTVDQGGRHGPERLGHGRLCHGDERLACFGVGEMVQRTCRCVGHEADRMGLCAGVGAGFAVLPDKGAVFVGGQERRCQRLSVGDVAALLGELDGDAGLLHDHAAGIVGAGAGADTEYRFAHSVCLNCQAVAGFGCAQRQQPVVVGADQRGRTILGQEIQGGGAAIREGQIVLVPVGDAGGQRLNGNLQPVPAVSQDGSGFARADRLEQQRDFAGVVADNLSLDDAVLPRQHQAAVKAGDALEDVGADDVLPFASGRGVGGNELHRIQRVDDRRFAHDAHGQLNRVILIGGNGDGG